MKAKAVKKKVTDEKYYDKHGILGEIVEGDVALSLEDALRQDILLKATGFIQKRGEIRRVDSDYFAEE